MSITQPYLASRLISRGDVMTSAILTLQMPLRGKVVPLATSTAPTVIANFCRAVYADYVELELMAVDEVEACIYRAEWSGYAACSVLLAPTYLSS